MSVRRLPPGVLVLGVLVLGVLVLVILAAGVTHAQPAADTADAVPLAQLPAPAVWLTPVAESNSGNEAGPPVVYALLADGAVMRIAAGGRQQQLAAGWQGGWLRACGAGAERVLGVNAEGRLAALPDGATGPRVSPPAVPACLPDGRIAAVAPNGALLLLSPALELLAEAQADALPDAEVVVTSLEGGAPLQVALLSGPTERYPHGVLGDRLEASAVSVYAVTEGATALQLRYRFALPRSQVIEQRRVTPTHMSGEPGLLITRSSSRAGAGVVLLAVRDGELQPVAAGPEIGLANRWLNLFAAHGPYAYAVKTPHIGGPLERYRLSGDALSVEAFSLGVTNHVIGARNLDLGALLPADAGDADLLALPERGLGSVRFIRCDGAGCTVAAERRLAGRLSSNLAPYRPYRAPGGRGVLAADSRGWLYWLVAPEPAAP